MRTLLLSRSVTFASLLLASVTAASAQTYFYINSISVSPAEPTETDAITISLTGDLGSSGAYIVSAEYMLMDNIVHITVLAADPGGLAVLVPHTEEIVIGILPVGSYGILVDGAAIDDSAPEFQHSFNVSGVGASCNALDLISVQWSTFSDTAITVHVTNASFGFDYPGFVLFDENGDTLAKEAVNLFGIAADSWHTLGIQPDAQVPEGAFTGTLQLWTGFYDELACTWDQAFDLCPAAECVTVHPNLNNFGNALVEGSFSWSINNEDGVVESGIFELTGEIQSGIADVCLASGNYEFQVIPLQEPGGGQLVMGVGGEAWYEGVQQPLFQGIPTAPLVFELLEQCVDGTNVTEEINGSVQLMVTAADGTILVRDPTGTQLGTVTLCDALGKEIARAMTGNDRLLFEVATDGMYILRTNNAIVKVIVERR